MVTLRPLTVSLRLISNCLDPCWPSHVVGWPLCIVSMVLAWYMGMHSRYRVPCILFHFLKMLSKVCNFMIKLPFSQFCQFCQFCSKNRPLFWPPPMHLPRWIPTWAQKWAQTPPFDYWACLITLFLNMRRYGPRCGDGFSQSQGFAMGSCKKTQSIDGFLQNQPMGFCKFWRPKLEWTHAREHRSPGHNRHAKQHAEAYEQAESPVWRSRPLGCWSRWSDEGRMHGGIIFINYEIIESWIS